MKSQVDIITQAKNGKTVLKTGFFTPPLKIANVTENRQTAAELRLMLMSSSPGILNDDDFHIYIELVAETRLHLSTQAFQRIFTMPESSLGARQRTDIALGAGSRLRFIAHPSVLHRHAAFATQTVVHLAETATLIFGEILTVGREGQNELFQFSFYKSLIDIYLGQKLIFRDNQYLCPAEQNLTEIGFYESFTHQAILLVFGTQLPLKTLLETLNERLKTYGDSIEGAATLTAQHGILTRILGTKAEQLFTILNDLADLIHD